MNTASRGPASTRVLPRITLAILLLLVSRPHALHAQPAPLRHMYGVGDNEFYIGAQLACEPADKHHLDELWNFLNTMGVRIMTYDGRWSRDTNITPFLNSPLRHANPADSVWNRMVATTEPLTEAGNGGGYELYPFDSTQSSFFRCKFTQRAGGATVTNQTEHADDDPNISLAEELYDTTTTTPGQMVASGLAYNYSAAQVYRFPQDLAGGVWVRHADSTVQSTDRWAIDRRNPNDPILYVSAMGHLFYPTSANDLDSNILRIEVWYEVPRGTAYYTDPAHTAVAAANLDTLYATFFVRKRDFIRANNNVPEGKYQEIAFKLDLRQNAAGLPGPLFAGNTSRRFDVRVYWTGAERLALRSVSLRDSIGQLVLGKDSASDAYRAHIVRSARWILTGDTASGHALRDGVIMLSAGIELFPTEDAGTIMVNRLVRDSFNIQGPPADTVGIYTFGTYMQNGMYRYQERMNTPMVMTETLHDKAESGHQYEAPYGLLPSISQHNGGRGFVAPLLPLTAVAIEDFETTWQRMMVGRNGLDPNVYPYNSGWVPTFSRGADIFRTKGRRMLSMIGTNTRIQLRRDSVGTRHDTINGHDTLITLKHLDTLLERIPEAAEIRLNTNLALCYGSRGIEWYWLGSGLNFLDPMDSVGVQDSFGSNGPLPSDTTQNVMDLVTTDADTWGVNGYPLGHYPGGLVNVVLPHVYVGWGDRSREIRHIDGWLAHIGPEMAKLRWRDGYSIHGQAARPGTTDTIPGRRPNRTLPANEIVTHVTASSLNSGLADPPYATYVELGFFDTKPGRDAGGVLNPLYDTNHVFVVNRRIFERPDGIDLYGPDSTDAQKMELLTESRRITLDLNLHHPNGEAYNFVRVREVEPDMTPIAGDPNPRHALDTILYGDSTLAITLRPGGAALLRITYCPPETALGPAELRRSSQKKILYSGNRYYATYVHQKTCFFPFGAPKKSQHAATNDAVFLRRSYPMADTVGGIQWEPIEYTVSDTTSEQRFLENRFPSLTLR
ncbi:MAG TPA: hypothetical protein VHI13_15250, partial [Candidatus Kapabacteria bacterium]|nr:hypothetical protein [Candidatus Kapabacteria bacterium]